MKLIDYGDSIPLPKRILLVLMLPLTPLVLGVALVGLLGRDLYWSVRQVFSILRRNIADLPRETRSVLKEIAVVARMAWTGVRIDLLPQDTHEYRMGRRKPRPVEPAEDAVG